MTRGLRLAPYEERPKQLGLPTLSYRRTHGDMIMMYTILTGKVKSEDDQVQLKQGRQLRCLKQDLISSERVNGLKHRGVCDLEKTVYIFLLSPE